MPATNLNPSRASQPAAARTKPSPLPPSDGRERIRKMSWAQWHAIPRSLRIERGATRCVMEHTQHGIVLHAVHITG